MTTMRRLVFLASISIFACSSARPDARAQLEAMLGPDQSYRSKIQEIALKNPEAPELAELWKKQQEIDQSNLKNLDAIIAADGWPKVSVVGEKAASAAFLIVQHADSASQEKYLPLLKAAVAAGEARPGHLALLQDRVLMAQGKKQIYGSQLQPNDKGGWEFYPIEDEKNVDARRKEMGLPPLAEYAKHFGIEYKAPHDGE